MAEVLIVNLMLIGILVMAAAGIAFLLWLQRSAASGAAAPSLTDDDIDRIQDECDCPGCDSCDIRIHEFARAVEAHVRGVRWPRTQRVTAEHVRLANDRMKNHVS